MDSSGDAGLVATCPGQLAQRAFRYALCVCDNYVGTGALTTDAFDSAQGSYDAAPALAAGAVGVDGSFNPSGAAHIDGSLWASGSEVSTTSSLYVAGDLHAQGQVHPSANPEVMADALDVSGDAWLAGGLQTNGNVAVGGTLHVPSTASLQVTGKLTHQGATDTAAFTVASACDCGHPIDVAGIIASYDNDNDNASLGLPHPEDFLQNVQTDVDETLPCGRYFLSEIGSNTAAIHLHVQGRVALFVKSGISTNGNFVVDVPANSELDLFVGGTVTIGGAFTLGDASDPARARIYVAGDSVNLANTTTMAGNLYAPLAQLTLGMMAPTTLYGAMFVDRLNASANLTIHYDAAVLTQPSTPACAAPRTCTTSCDCAGQACSGGTCGECSDTAPCCAPFVCGPLKTCVAEVPR
jgi:hypothetical protein